MIYFGFKSFYLKSIIEIGLGEVSEADFFR